MYIHIYLFSLNFVAKSFFIHSVPRYLPLHTFPLNVTLLQKVQLVESLFGKLDHEISQFQSKSALYCISGCGKCCNKPDIEATILEFLPLAQYYYENEMAEKKLEDISLETSSICQLFTLHILGKHGGMCNDYPHRGLICRLFGFSSGRDKYGESTLITCKSIKTELKPQYENTLGFMSQGLAVPSWSNYYQELQDIDYNLSDEFYPINHAMKLALEYVLQYYFYNKPTDSGLRNVS